MFCNFSCAASGSPPLKGKRFPSRASRVCTRMNIFHWWIRKCRRGVFDGLLLGVLSDVIMAGRRAKHPNPQQRGTNIRGLRRPLCSILQECLPSRDPARGVHRGAHICLRSSHPSWSSVGFRIFDRSLFLTALFSITPGLHNTWGCYIVMNNLAAESKLGWNSSDTFRENFKLLERWRRVKWGTIRGASSCLIFGQSKRRLLLI